MKQAINANSRRRPSDANTKPPAPTAAPASAEPSFPSVSIRDDPWRTTDEVAERYRTAPSTVRYWRHAGIGPKGTLFGKRVLYRESELRRWEAEREAEQATR